MPVFATELLKTASVANLFGQNFIFKNEDPQAQSRPIWILAGDSLSSGWANKDSLLELYQTASRRPLQRAGSAFDLLQHLPSSATTWFAGSSFHYGVFGFLSPEWANRPDPMFILSGFWWPLPMRVLCSCLSIQKIQMLKTLFSS
jgi:hypothetical protein